MERLCAFAFLATTVQMNVMLDATTTSSCTKMSPLLSVEIYFWVIKHLFRKNSLRVRWSQAVCSDRPGYYHRVLHV